MKLLAVPVPAFVAAALPQLPSELFEGAPAWVLALAVVGWVVVSVLNMLGRLPQKNGGTHSGFTADDRRTIQKTYEVLAWRDDDGVQRFVGHVIEQRKLVQLSEDHHRLVGVVVDQFQTTNRRLISIEKRLGIGGEAS